MKPLVPLCFLLLIGGHPAMGQTCIETFAELTSQGSNTHVAEPNEAIKIRPPAQTKSLKQNDIDQIIEVQCQIHENSHHLKRNEGSQFVESRHVSMARTALFTSGRLSEVEAHYHGFGETGFKVGSVQHNMIVEIAFLRSVKKAEQQKFLEELNQTESGFKPGSLPHLFAIQTSILSGKSIQEVSAFFNDIPRLPWTKGNINYWLVAQAAFLLGAKPAEVGKDFRILATISKIPTVGSSTPNSLGHQTSYLLSLGKLEN